MRLNVKKWGNSLGLRIPKPLAIEAGIEAGESVEVSLQDGKVVIEAIRSPAYALADLVDAITAKNIHDVIDTGPPAGKEIW